MSGQAAWSWGEGLGGTDCKKASGNLGNNRYVRCPNCGDRFMGVYIGQTYFILTLNMCIY